MNFTSMRRKIGGAALTFAMLAGIGFAASDTAQAQYRRYDDYRYDDQVRWERERTREYAFILGYHNAYTEGQEAAERGYRPDYRSMPGYRNSDNGWRPWMGHDDTYRDSYRRGYEAGFKDGQAGRNRRYDRRDVERVLGTSLGNVYDDDNYNDRDYRYDRRDNRRYDDRRYNDVYSVAQQNGYRDGIRQGQEDRARRRGYDADNSSEYRNALRGYRSEYGNRAAYQRAYREGFVRGYDEGYRRSTNTGRFPWPF